ncbi:MAG: hypothetical protein JSR39_00295 [Verrucomicrobia bacterium]|nr:hypothetical protein [Verrucomicrobiota bacterium]
MGSIKISLNFVRGSQGLQSQLQSIKGQLDTIQSTRQVTKLTRELDRTSTALRDMKDKAQNVFGQSQQDYFGGLEDEIIHMYGKIEDVLVSRKVSQIHHEAESLKDSMAHGDPVDTKAVNTLKRHICSFLKDYRPGLKDRQVINDARQALKEADLTLKGKVPDEKPIAHFDWLVQQRDVRLIEDIELEPGQYEDLFDIAAMVYNGKMREARAAYNQLPENLKRTFHQHLRELTAVAFDDEVETIQALLATANQLVNNREPYPTKGQIDEIFMGLRNVTAEEEKSPVRFSLRSSN